jgi:hypothetical protein
MTETREPSLPADRLRRATTWAAVGILLASLAMYALFRRGGLTVGLFRFQDFPVLMLGGVLLLYVALRPRSMATWRPRRPDVFVLLLALAVLLVTLVGTWLVFGDFPLTRDEILADFDAGFISQGRLIAPVAPEWQSFAPALMPQFMLPVPIGTGWLSGYLPGNAALRAIGEATIGAEWISPILTAISVVAVYRIGRRLWPDAPDAAIVAAVLLASSAQVLAMGMTAYAMSAHLALNLVWLWCFLRDDWRGDAGALAAGWLATGLHQLLFHPLFVAPFILQLWLARRWRRALVYTLGYAAIGLFWISYWQILLAGAGVAGDQASATGAAHLVERVITLLGGIDASAFSITAFNLLRFLSWQNLILLPFALLAWPALRRGEGLARPLAAGLLLTVAAMLVLLPWQGLGWGYRYLHGLVGSCCLLAGYGWKSLGEDGETRMRDFMLAAGTAASLLIVLPLHLKQAHDFVAPTRRAYAIVSGAPVDVVIVAPVADWFDDLVRNRADLSNRPKVMNGSRLSEAQARALCARYRVGVFDIRHGAALGYPASASPQEMEAHRAVLRRTGCAHPLPLS